MNRGIRRAAALTLALAAGVIVAPAQGYTLTKLKPARVTHGSLLFKLPKVRPRRIRSARLVVQHHAYPLPLGRVRDAVHGGALAIRPPAGSVATHAASILVLQVSPGSGTPTRDLPPVPHASVAPDSGPTAIASGVLTNPTCLPAYGSFDLGARPPGCWRPYSETSPFNRMIPAGAPAAANSAGVVGRTLSFGPLQNLLAGRNSGRPIFFSSPSDPVFTLHCTERWGTCAIEGAAVRFPDAARAAPDEDAHLSVVDQASGWEYDLWGVQSKPAGGGVLSFRWGGKTRIDGDGTGSGAVAANYGTAAGILRAEELASGHINHALFLAVNCDSGQHVYPAAKGGRRCADPTDAPAEGTRFQLTMTDAQIAASGVPEWKKTILRAMAHYGLIVGDTGGSWAIAQESDVVYTSRGATSKWVTLAQQLKLPYYAPDHDYVFRLNDGVDWGRYLRVVDPCVSAGTC